jgi:NNP family nitrate/nitrite transporter-like MFS transporter
VAIRLPGIGPLYAGTAGGLIATLELLGGVVLPTYVASAIAGANRGVYFIILGIASVVWIIGVYFMPKELDTKG